MTQSCPDPRRDFAAGVVRRMRIESGRLEGAFAAVKREEFLGPGPWWVVTARGYERTADGDPRHVLRDVAVAIDVERRLHNGQPSQLALLIDALAIEPGDRVVHVGCGTGYYTAILAELVGPEGHVTAAEIDPDLVPRARSNLARWAAVEVVEGDGSGLPAGAADAVLVNAGVASPTGPWLDALRSGGRLVLPLTGAQGTGGFLRVAAAEDPARWPARFLLWGGAYPCAAGPGGEERHRIDEAYARGGWERVDRLRRDPHPQGGDCWLHGADWCLATAPGDDPAAGADPSGR